MALLEKENGIRATYFLLPPSPSLGGANYYGAIRDTKVIPDSGLADQARKLVEWGHDVGLENNIAELAVYLRRGMDDILREQVDFFRNQGIELAGTAAHGSPFFHEHDFTSYEIFAQAKTREGKARGRTVLADGCAIQLHSLNLADFGFSYEAYSLPFETTLSDSNCVWGGKLVRDFRPDLNSLDAGERWSAFREMISSAQPSCGVLRLQVLIHPEHWEIS